MGTNHNSTCIQCGKFAIRSHPPEGNGGTGQGGAPNDLPNIAATAAANGSHDGQNNEDEEINDINEDEKQNSIACQYKILYSITLVSKFLRQ